METSRPNILDYEDYRKFLGDWYNWMKTTNPAFSFRAFSNWAGFHSPNQLQLIIQGKRNITRNTIGSFLKVLKLKHKEQKFFELLVNFNQAETSETKARYLLEITDYHKKYGELLKTNQYEYLTKWYMPVLRELVSTKDFKEDPNWISKRLGDQIAPKQIKESIEKLIYLGLLEKSAKKLKQSSTIVTTGKDASDSAAYLYHSQMLNLALSALNEQKPEERNFAGITLACSKDDLSEIAQIIFEFRTKILSYLDNRENKQKDDEVYQLGIQFFRITKKENQYA